MGKYVGQIPVANIGSSHGFFQDRMNARPIRSNKRVAKFMEVVKRSAQEEYRNGTKHW